MTRIAHVSMGDLAAQNIAALIVGRLDERQIIMGDYFAYGPLCNLHTAAGRDARAGLQDASEPFSSGSGPR